MVMTRSRKYDSPRQRERRSRILATARQMLDDEGYAGMTMRTLAERAGVASATLYNLYSSKDELVLAALDDLVTEIRHRIVAGGERPGLQTVLAHARAVAEQTIAAPAYGHAMIRMLFSSGPSEPVTFMLFERGRGELVEHLEIAIRNGELRDDLDLERVSYRCQEQLWGTVLAWDHGILGDDPFVAELEVTRIVTLMPVATPAGRRALEARLAALETDAGASLLRRRRA